MPPRMAKRFEISRSSFLNCSSVMSCLLLIHLVSQKGPTGCRLTVWCSQEGRYSGLDTTSGLLSIGYGNCSKDSVRTNLHVNYMLEFRYYVNFHAQK